MSLADLYGPGAALDLRNAMTPASQNFTLSALQSDTPVGVLARGIYNRVEDGEVAGVLKLMCTATTVHITSLWLYGDLRGTGIVSRYARRLGDWAQKYNIPEITAAVPEEYTRWLFRRTGAESRAGDLVAWRTQGVGQRRLEYADWKDGLTPEPAWHAELVANVPPASGPNARIEDTSI